MKILIASNMDSGKPYGNFTRPFYLGQELSKHAEVLQLGYDCSRVYYAPSLSAKSYSVLNYIKFIRRASRDFRPDIIYSQENRPNISSYIFSHLRGGYRHVFDFHASPAFEYKENGFALKRIRAATIEKKLLSSGNAIILASDYLKKTIIREYGEINNDRWHVVPNGVPSSLLEMGKAVESPYKKIKGGVALAIAPRNFHSNVESVRFLIEVAKISLDKSPLTFVILGGGPELPAPTNVVYAGHVDDIIPYIDYADICLSPYPGHAVCGGARNKVFDFFARKKVVLSTENGVSGIQEAEHLKNVYVSLDDPVIFAKDLANLSRNISMHSNIGDEAFTLVSEKYNWRRSANRLLEVFQTIMKVR